MEHVNNNLTYRKSKIDFSSLFISIMIIIIMLLILLDPITYSKSIINGLSLFYLNVLPGLLPFMFFIKILTNQNIIIRLTKPLKKISYKFFGINEYGFYAFLMSIISGYPIGSKITSDIYSQNKINKSQLFKTAMFSSTPGLIFVIGSVGGLMLNSLILGLYIYLINISACIITTLIINLFSKNKTQQNLTPANLINTKQPIGSITQDTTISLLTVGFYIALFSLIIDLLTNLKIFSFLPAVIGLSPEKTRVFQCVMSGIIEMTNGVKMLSININPLSLSLISAITSFSGISIIMQSLSFLSQTNIKTHKFILGKALQATISFCLAFVFFNIKS